jgi:metalloendopeptidase OMA1, mitochondrial
MGIMRAKKIPRVVLLPLLVLSGCATAPYTERSQLILISPGEENRLGAQAFQQVLAKEKVVRDPVLQGVVDRIGWRIANAARRPDFQWEFVIIDNEKTANAFALPGGKVAVYTGMFPVARTEGGLAAVLAHEVAHVLARHGGERLSQGLVAQIGATALQVGMAGRDPGVVRGVMAAYGLGANVGVLLPYGRLQESEADRIGLILMAQASYDPREAIHLWERMEQQDGQRPPEFLSTHPSVGRRIQDLQRWMPNALTHYRPSPDQIPDSARPLPSVGGRGSG